MAEEKSAKRRRRGAVFYTPIAALLIIIILIFGISVFFRIAAIEVTGAGKYTVEQIISVSGIKEGDNLIFVDAKAAEQKIGLNLPYLNEVVIEKIIPDRVVINVTESKSIAVLSYGGSWWIIDQKARVLEKAGDEDAAGKMTINGIEPVSLVEGRVIIVDKKNETQLKYLIDVLGAIYSAGLSEQVGALDISNISNISFTLSDRFTVVLGSGQDADYKVAMLLNVIPKLAPDENGKIDLTREGKPHFIPS
ncbi:MAG: FtsQ-type POTRA domain-containing protein [Clostridiales bacterium]|nr:FtsQ-type POTRA domain-containing protein [Clostridiales bacterium]